MNYDDTNLDQFATDRQFQILHAIRRCEGNTAQAALSLGITEHTVQDSMRVLKSYANSRGYAPEYDQTRPVPEGQLAGGVSTYYNKEGKPSQQWVKSKMDMERHRTMVRSMVASLLEEARGRSIIVEPPRMHDSALMAVIPIGDPHFGLQVWGEECGDSFDLKIAKKLMLGAADQLMVSTPSADTCCIIILGDTFHMNDQSNKTPRSGHQLDADGRFVKVLDVTIHTYRQFIYRALEKHKKVIVRVVKGNHDPEATWALAYALSAFFHNDQRVKIELSPSPFWYHRFGKVLIAATHGDDVKHGQLGQIMSTDRAADWGRTQYRYWYTGHVHSKHVTELPGVMCESFRTLAASDSFAHGHGYRSGRDIISILHHKEYGEVTRHRVDISMIQKTVRK